MAKAPRVPTHSASQTKSNELILPYYSFDICEQPNLQSSNLQKSLFDLKPYEKPRCTCKTTKIGPGTEVHFARLECADCGRFIKWLPKPRNGEVSA